MIESLKTLFRDSLSVPKTIGTGPIRIAPPPFNFPFLAVWKKNASKVRIIKAIPTKISIKPIETRVWGSIPNC